MEKCLRPEVSTLKECFDNLLRRKELRSLFVNLNLTKADRTHVDDASLAILKLLG